MGRTVGNRPLLIDETTGDVAGWRHPLDGREQLLAAASLTAAQVTALVSALPVFSGTWAALHAGNPAASYSGRTALVVDPTYFTNTLRVRSDGTKWRLDGWQDLYFNITPLTGTVGTVATEQLQMQWTAPAGFLTSLRQLSLKRVCYKTATSDTYTERVRVGAGTTPLSDTVILANSAAITTTNRSGAPGTVLTFPSATQARTLGQQIGIYEWNGSSSSTSYPQNATIADSDAAATVFSCTMQLATGTDSSASGQAHLIATGS